MPTPLRDSAATAQAGDRALENNSELDVLVTCEHATNAIPLAWRGRFHSPEAQRALDSHRGWDPGAREIAKRLAKLVNAPVVKGKASRLLVDLNRSPDNTERWSEFTRELNDGALDRIDAKFGAPFRLKQLNALTQAARKSARLLQMSIHTFTPELNGEVRDVDIGVLFDPAREWEAEFAAQLMAAFERDFPELRVRANVPYPGVMDGSITWLRGQTTGEQFAGIELEVNQALVFNRAWRWRTLHKRIAQTMADTIRSARTFSL